MLGRLIGDIGVRVTKLDVSSYNEGEACGELNKRMDDMCCLQEVMWEG